MTPTALCVALVLSGLASAANGADFDELTARLQTPDVTKCVLALARDALESEVLGKRTRSVHDIPEILADSRAGAFVTVKSGGQLRSCWGSVWPAKENLAEEIEAAARGTAASDPRFKPIRPDELKGLRCTVSIVCEPETVRSLSEIRPAQDGVLVRQGERSGVALPHEGRTVSYLIEIACKKAGISGDGGYEILRFRTIKIEDAPKQADPKGVGP